MTRVIFGGVIAFILLGLYVYTVLVAIKVVQCISTTGCSTYTATNFNIGMVSVLTLVGGLVSALVVAELAVTPPNEAPAGRIVASMEGNSGTELPLWASRTVKIATIVYLSVWVITGLLALVFGVLWHPQVLQSLTDLGASWLGLAVAAAYSYLGIRPSTSQARSRR